MKRDSFYPKQWAGFLALLLLAISLAAFANSADYAQANTSQRQAKRLGRNRTSQGLHVAPQRAWTRAEMLAAESLDFNEIDPATVTAPAPRAVKGAPGQSSSGVPKALSTHQPSTAGGFSSVASPGAILGYSYPGPFTRFEIFTDYLQFPYVTIGRLFFTQGGRGASCSAASVGNYAVFTAGHCVHSGNNSDTGWSTNVVFVPAYKDGNAPLGQWSASWLATKTAWYANKNFRRDMGAAVLFADQNSNKISDVVGWLGFSWNFPYEQHWNALGYPAEGSFTGNRLIVCEASFAYTLSPSGAGPNPMAIGCDMTRGQSGGPWIKDFSGEAGATNHLNGVNSYRRRGYSQEQASPYFDNAAKSLFDLAVGGTP